jgi:hypothetical protein
MNRGRKLVTVRWINARRVNGRFSFWALTIPKRIIFYLLLEDDQHPGVCFVVVAGVVRFILVAFVVGKWIILSS